MAALTEQDEARLREIIEKDWVEIGLRRDFGALLGLCSEDFVYLPPDSPTLRGKAEARTFLDAFPEADGVGQTVHRVWGDQTCAAMHGAFEGSFTADGHTLSAKGKFLCTARKDGGEWLLTSSCFNFDAPPA